MHTGLAGKSDEDGRRGEDKDNDTASPRQGRTIDSRFEKAEAAASLSRVLLRTGGRLTPAGDLGSDPHGLYSVKPLSHVAHDELGAPQEATRRIGELL